MNGRRVLVTGAAGGIGTSLVAELLLQGTQVLATDVDASGCERLERRFGDRLHVVRLDLTESGAHQVEVGVAADAHHLAVVVVGEAVRAAGDV
ncbi:SDR family NAD(P)-dependent oxidoreductase, partial [Streptosporangium sp. NPDC006013]|uniref:SDR family NAD(P)-dependent oxidoreductase n=1 Tax=Streptosporangium sp. NPDC006013 TaxID=3155596 RepID=UPI0033A15DCA